MRIVRWGAAAILLFIAALWIKPATAAVSADNFLLRDAADLLAVCSPGQDDKLMTTAVNFCDGFIVGVYRTLEAAQNATGAKLFCTPSPAPSRAQAITAFIQWAKTHTDLAQRRSEDAVLAYLAERFPCAQR